MSEPTRTYTNGEISVEWRPELCTKCESCWRGLPAVFNPEKRPWVTMAGATTEQITAQVNECPTGALSIGKA